MKTNRQAKPNIPARYLREADNVIKIMKAFKRGQPIQKRGKYSTGDEWVDFDFREHINTPRVHYRVKPNRSTKRKQK